MSEKDEIDAEIAKINKELNTLGKKCSETLSFLSDTDIFNCSNSNLTTQITFKKRMNV